MGKNKEKDHKARKRGQRLPRSVKQLIGYDSMLRNGIAYLGDDRWSATILFQDINYQLSQEEHQIEIIDRWAKLINSFDAGQSLQIAAYTRTRGMDEILRDVTMPDHGDGLDAFRRDYNSLVAGKLESASRNTSTVKTLTVTIREPDRETAVSTLNALCTSLTAQMRAIDECHATRLDRAQRLRLMAEILRPGEPFEFDERAFESMPGRPDTKDLVCPWSIDARDPARLDVESESSRFHHRTLWISGLPPELSDQLINDLTSIRAHVNVSIHLAPYDRGESMTIVRRKNAEIKMQVMETRRRNRKQGLDPDDLPDDLADQQAQLGELRDELSKTDQRLVNGMIVIGVSAESPERLDLACKTVKAKVNAQSCKAESLKFMQLEGLVAELPLGNNPLPMTRTLTTNSAAILIPFTTQEVFEPRGLFYGSNARSGNPIVADRRAHMNSNGFILGTSGGGKSFTFKQEIAGLFLNRDDEIIIIDPEREYLPLAQAFGGQIVRISAGSTSRINPLDVVLEETGDGDPVKEKTNNVVSMIGSLVGGNEGLDPMEKSLVDRCALQLYVRFREQGADPAAQPTLGDLRDMLEATGETAGHELAVALGSYTSGSLSGFNGQTNVDLDNRFTVFDVSGLTGELRTFGMMVVIDQVWNRVIRNRARARRTWLWIDEFHRFFGNQYSAGQFKDIYKRSRKYGLGVTGVTQNIEELLLDDDARLMLSNSDFLMLLSQNSSDADELCSLLKLSEEQRQFFTGVLPGQGLMKIGRVRAVRRANPVRRPAVPALLHHLRGTVRGIPIGHHRHRHRRGRQVAHHGRQGRPRRRGNRGARLVAPDACRQRGRLLGMVRRRGQGRRGRRLGHEAAKAAARGANAGRHAVGRTAGATRKALNSARRRGREAYKAKLKAGRAAKGGPTRVADARASDRIAKLKKAGKASLRIGKRIGTASRDLAFRAGRAGVKGVTSSSRFMWRHRKAPVKAAKATAGGARATVRAARAAAMAIRAAATAVVSAVTSAGLPLIAILAAILAVVAMIAGMFSFLFGAANSSTDAGGVDNVPAEYLQDVIRAGSVCETVTPSVIAAQIEAESNWNPKAGSSAGAQGIAQFMPMTWASVGKDGDGDGKADVWNAHDAIWTQGNYMCGLASQVETAKKAGKLTGDTLGLTLAAYNAGIGSVLRYGMIPPFGETRNYVQRILELAQTKYTATTGGSDGGPTVGSLKPKLVMKADHYHVDIEAMGLRYERFPDYDTYQCTWWAAMRRNQIGKPVDAHMGNGGQWNDTARRLGYKVGGSPKPGDAMAFEPGTLGSSGTYGHVAVVEEVKTDGGIVISESGTGFISSQGAVVIREISAAQLKAVAGHVTFIH